MRSTRNVSKISLLTREAEMLWIYLPDQEAPEMYVIYQQCRCWATLNNQTN